jgi:hypothetical protein
MTPLPSSPRAAARAARAVRAVRDVNRVPVPGVGHVVCEVEAIEEDAVDILGRGQGGDDLVDVEVAHLHMRVGPRISVECSYKGLKLAPSWPRSWPRSWARSWHLRVSHVPNWVPAPDGANERSVLDADGQVTGRLF